MGAPCLPCGWPSAGSYSLLDATDYSCTACSTGKYLGAVGRALSTLCQDCTAGTFASEAGAHSRRCCWRLACSGCMMRVSPARLSAPAPALLQASLRACPATPALTRHQKDRTHALLGEDKGTHPSQSSLRVMPAGCPAAEPWCIHSLCRSPYRSYARVPGAAACVQCAGGVVTSCVVGTCSATPSPGKRDLAFAAACCCLSGARPACRLQSLASNA